MQILLRIKNKSGAELPLRGTLLRSSLGDAPEAGTSRESKNSPPGRARPPPPAGAHGPSPSRAHGQGHRAVDRLRGAAARPSYPEGWPAWPGLSAREAGSGGGSASAGAGGGRKWGGGGGAPRPGPAPGAATQAAPTCPARLLQRGGLGARLGADQRGGGRSSSLPEPRAATLSSRSPTPGPSSRPSRCRSKLPRVGRRGGVAGEGRPGRRAGGEGLGRRRPGPRPAARSCPEAVLRPLGDGESRGRAPGFASPRAAPRASGSAAAVRVAGAGRRPGTATPRVPLAALVPRGPGHPRAGGPAGPPPPPCALAGPRSRLPLS